MSRSFITTGIVTDGKTIVLDDSLPVEHVKVRVTIETFSRVEPRRQSCKPNWLEVMNQIWDEQRGEHFVPRAAVEVEAEVCEERQSWGD